MVTLVLSLKNIKELGKIHGRVKNKVEKYMAALNKVEKYGSIGKIIPMATIFLHNDMNLGSYSTCSTTLILTKPQQNFSVSIFLSLF
jgi:uncharacterized membrane protein